jgi:putative phage-type endonuclease
MDGVIKIPLPKTHEEWLEDRRKGIGGSDVGVVLGLNKYKSPYTLWAEKSGLLHTEEIDNESMRIGRDLEDYVAKRFMEATGHTVVTSDYSFQSERYPFMLANVDRLLTDEPCGLECKTASALTRYDFENGDIPPSYYCQCMHYMAVTGLKKWYIAILVMGKGFYWFEINRDEEEIKALIEAEEDFWNKVQTGEAPPIDGTSSTATTLGAVFNRSKDNKECVLGHEAETALNMIYNINEKFKELKEQKTLYENIVKREMEDAERAEVEGLVVTWNRKETERFNQSDLKKYEPSTYKRFMKKTTSERFMVKKKK